MRLAIMQPYLFPYIGYFQLIAAVDRFVIYDDVSFIKQGWINRNRILGNERPLMFSIPLSGAGSHVAIRNVRISQPSYCMWRAKFIKTLEQTYRKAPWYHFAMPLVEDVLTGEPELVSVLATKSIKSVCNYLGISTDVVETSAHYGNNNLKAEERVIDICHQEGADCYVNPIGGTELYSKDSFRKSGITLRFLKSKEITYQQKGSIFVSWLSIIDVLMFNSVETTLALLQQHDLI
jgi:hypothetical protein